MPTINDLIPEMTSFYKERNPQIHKSTLNIRKRQLLYLSKFFPQSIEEITKEQIQNFTSKKLEVSTLKTTLIDLRNLEICFIITRAKENPVTSIIDSYLSNQHKSSRHKRINTVPVNRQTGYSFKKSKPFLPEEEKEPEEGLKIKEENQSKPINDPIYDFFTVIREWAALMDAESYSFSCKEEVITVILSGVKCGRLK